MQCLTLRLLLCCVLSSSLLAALQAQTSIYQVEAERGQRLGTILSDLERRYDLEFAYPSELQDRQWQQDISLSSSELLSLLNELMSWQEIRVQRMGAHQYLLRPVPVEQKRTSIRGRISNQAGDPLDNAIVLWIREGLGAYTDAEGRFTLDLDRDLQATDSLLVRSLGYVPSKIALQKIIEEPLIRMEAASYDLPAITVTEKLPALSLQEQRVRLQHNRSFRQDGLSELGPAVRDLFRQLQLLPGVYTADDADTELRIRGSAGSETLVLLDDIPLYHSGHFYGIFSAISPAWISNAELHRNNAPIRYGGKTGGALLLQSADSIRQAAVELEADLLTGTAMLQLPMSDRWSLQAAGRTTWQSIAASPLYAAGAPGTEPDERENLDFTRADLLSQQPDFTFSDFYTKVQYLGSRSRLSLNTYYSEDQFSNRYTNDFLSRFQWIRRENTERFLQEEDWEVFGASLQYRYEINADWSLNSSAYHSRYDNGSALQVGLEQRNRRTDELLRDFRYRNDRSTGISETGAYVSLQVQRAAHTLEFGVHASDLKASYEIRQDSVTILGRDASDGLLTAFSSYSDQSGPFTWEVGLRLSYFEGDQQARVAPRLSANYQLTDHLLLKSSLGRSYQYMREITYENRLGQSLELQLLSGTNSFPVAASWNTMLGASYTAGRFQVDLEAYIRRLEEVVEVASSRLGFLNTDIQAANSTNFRNYLGEGRVRGLDLGLAYRLDKLTSRLAYTLSQSQQRFDAIDANAWFAAADDRRHQFSWSTELELGPLLLATTYVFNSGRPYTNVSRVEQSRDRNFILPRDRQDRLPAYHRVDLGISYPFQLKQLQGSVGASVFNVTDHRNVAYVQYLLALPTLRDGENRNSVLGTETELLPRTYSLHLRLRFGA